ncbi:uncharacterized protein LOC62_05G006931 [Vanrija pseudolonga]|uniref:CST complex subunit Stn1 N-terminal domain-containing protein n=1 Tax=Vanrija pseudolonga TaxID=143232 RepID=A0AAF0YB19_9TREE|nr:hypothetical protein LOC62_05G006931 [Vanrija pseudolonga]
MSDYAATTYASTSAVRLAALPPLATLQSWVHRPQAVAACFVSDVYALQNLRESNAGVSRTSRDVFLLNHFPCKLVELVGWVAGVDHKDASMTITLDDGDGAHVLQVVVRLAKVEPPPTTKVVAAVAVPVNPNFLTAKERKAMRKAAAAAEAASLAAARSTAPGPTFHRPDVRVGDTLRVVGRVDEWARRRNGGEEWVRQVFVDEASGSGSLSVVDADEQFRHAAKVVGLHETLYSRPFTMPAPPAPVARSPPRATPHSTQSSPAKSTLSSIPSSDVYDDDFAPVPEARLTDPAKLRSSLLTEATFKRYLMDHVSRETARVLRSSPPLLGQAVPALAALFPEYRHAVLPRTGEDGKRDSFAPSHPRNGRQTKQWSLNGSPRCTTPDSDDDVVCLEATPKASKQSTFRSRTDRDDALRLNRYNFAPSSALRPWVDESDDGSDNDAPLGSEKFLLEPFTVDALMNVERLRVLGSKVAEVRARREERLRRQRAKENASTARDERVVQDRLNRGLRPDHWRLNVHEREHKLRRLTDRGRARSGSMSAAAVTIVILRNGCWWWPVLLLLVAT